jgi:phenol 2-monooxygenase (NADPH)
VRLYVDLGEIDPGERDTFRDKHSQAQVIAIAQRVLRPYTLDVKSVAWFAVYQVGQRVTDRFDDVPAEQAATRLPRVFIAGDACLTHQGGTGHECVDAGQLQSRLETGRGAAGPLPARAAAQLFGRAQGHRPGADRLRQGMVEDHGLAAE